jgi:hypothetical protein
MVVIAIGGYVILSSARFQGDNKPRLTRSLVAVASFLFSTHWALASGYKHLKSLKEQNDSSPVPASCEYIARG